MLQEVQAERPATASGLPLVGEMAWGTHFCLFYQSRSDLLDMLTSYFRAGLDADEFCVWVVPRVMTIAEAWAALQEAIPDVDQQAAAGRVELIPHDDWFLQGGQFEVGKVMNLLTAKIERASASGLSGLRLNGSPAWLQKRGAEDFWSFERAIDETIDGRRAIALCTFPLDGSNASEMLAAADTHHFTVAVRDGVAEIIERFERPPSEASLTARELEVLTWVAQGKSAWEIARILGIAKRTVDEHVQAATRKLGAVNRAQAVAMAMLRRIIKI